MKRKGTKYLISEPGLLEVETGTEGSISVATGCSVSPSLGPGGGGGLRRDKYLDYLQMLMDDRHV